MFLISSFFIFPIDPTPLQYKKNNNFNVSFFYIPPSVLSIMPYVL